MLFSGRELGADGLVVDAPEAVEREAALVEVAGGHHLVPVLVADAVVDAHEVDGRQRHRARRRVARHEPRQEHPRISPSRDERVRRVAVRANDGCHDIAIFALATGHARRLYGDGDAVGPGYGAVVDGLDIVDVKGDVLDGIAVALEVLVHFF